MPVYVLKEDLKSRFFFQVCGPLMKEEGSFINEGIVNKRRRKFSLTSIVNLFFLLYLLPTINSISLVFREPFPLLISDVY